MTQDRILFLQPPSPPFLDVLRDYAGGYGVALKTDRPDYGHDGGCTPYMHSMYAAGVLENAGYDITYLDCQAEHLAAVECMARIEQLDPDIIVSPINLPSLKTDLVFLSMVKELVSRVEIIAIGTVCKKLYKEVLSANCITAAVKGDVEMIILPLVQAISNKSDLSAVSGIAYRLGDDEICMTADSDPLPDLNQLPMPPYHKMPVKLYRDLCWGELSYMPIMDGRGCPFLCGKFCPYPLGFGKKPLYKDPEFVVDEIQYLHEQFGVEAFIFRNQNFTLNRKHAEGICEGILQRDIQVKWLCETRLDSVDPDILRLMSSAGCKLVHYGLETGDPEMFKSVGKPGSDLAVHGRAVKETKKAGMMPKLNVTIGLPGESWKSIRRTIQTIKELKPDVVMASIITPYPGTELYEEAIRQGLLLTDDWSAFTGYHPVMRTSQLIAEELLAAQRMVEGCLRISFPAKVFRKCLRLGVIS